MAGHINVAAVSQLSNKSAIERTSVVNGKEIAAQAKEVSEVSKVVIEKQLISVEELEPVVNQLNEFMAESQRSLSFSVDDSSGQVVVRVVDVETNELIRQMPGEDMLRFKQQFAAIVGMLYSKTA